MPKMTAKYKTACQTARKLDISTEFVIEGKVKADQEMLYRRLNDAGYWWDSQKKAWIEFASEPANEPDPLVRVRVWAEAGEKLTQACSQVKAAFGNGFALVQESEPYPCRPPKQRESRVYLAFIKVEARTKQELIAENDPFAVEIEEN